MKLSNISKEKFNQQLYNNKKLKKFKKFIKMNYQKLKNCSENLKNNYKKCQIQKMIFNLCNKKKIVIM